MDPTWEDVRAAVTAREAVLVAPDPLSSRAAVAIVLRDGADGIEVLFIRRAEHPQDPWSGQMAFPGGRAEPGDADLRATAVRETWEEIGVDLSLAADYLGPLDELQAVARMRPMNLSVAPFLFRLKEAFEPVLSAEVRSLHWLPLGELLGTSRRSIMDYAHQGVSLQFPCLRVDDLVIWGLTYRMFVGLQERLAAGQAADADRVPPASAGSRDR
jgi:8-oxo-dGTP pyrophosphatase MutT (NUDIX family)